MSILLSVAILFCADFPICTYTGSQWHPSVFYGFGQYYAFWWDYRNTDTLSFFGTRISTNGTVIDPNGKPIFRHAADFTPDIASDGANLFLVFRDYC